MKLKWFINAIAVALLIVAAFLGLAKHDSVIAAQDEGSKIEGSLVDRITTDGSADYIVRFTDQADLSAAYAMDWDARGEFVYNTLRETAYQSQLNAKALLDARGLTYQTFIAGNDLYVWGGIQTAADGITILNELAALPEVSFIRATRTYYIDPIIIHKPFDNVTWAGDLLASGVITSVGAPDAIEWGIADTKASTFWTTFGHSGDGIIVANIDTGVRYTHEALSSKYRCGAGPHTSCWFDPTGGTTAPTDDHGHGTHTMGTMVGSAGANQIGMAPSAKWIACDGCDGTNCTDYDLNSCADWILAPGGSSTNRPNVVNNSWGGGGGTNWYLSKVNAWRAAGIFPAFSAGNSGSSCSTLGSPGDYQESFGSAAHDSGRTIASFSSRGPSAFGHNPYTKPNISAPGVSVRSSLNTSNTSYGLMNGTSMASPHTAGAVALLWSCNPGLIGQINSTFQVLQNTANVAPAGNCGAPPDGQGNYTYGYGFLDVLAAGVGGGM